MWGQFDAAWWREDAPNARPKRPRIDHFLAHVLAAETGQSIAMRELYAEYRAFAIPRGRSRFLHVEDELAVLQKHAPIYRTLEGVESANPTMAWFGRKLSAWQITAMHPIALQIATSNLSPAEQEATARLLYSFIVRRAVTDLGGKNLNKLVTSIAQHFFEVGPSSSTLMEFFRTRRGESSRFPSDAEFREGIISSPVYLLAQGERTKDILWELELASRTRFAERVERPAGLWTEHVLPQSWNQNWPFADHEFVTRYSGDPLATSRNILLHALGNLTLISDGLNISSSNSSFAEKREKYETHATLFLNKWFSKKEAWTEADIRERGAYFADLAVAIWPGIDPTA